jgi:membrane-associated protein
MLPAKVRLAIRAAAFPLVVLALLVIFMAAYRILHLPPSDELVRLASSYMARYGYSLVFIGAFFEATPVVNFYLPGSTIVILAVALSRQGTLNVFGVLAVATIAFMLSYAVDYASGRYGWYVLMLRFGLGPSLDRTRVRLERHGIRWLWIAYVHPNIGALAATGCGILRLPFGRFACISAAALVCWDAAWGAIAFYGSRSILRFSDIRWFALLVVAWVLYAALRGIRRSRSEQD